MTRSISNKAALVAHVAAKLQGKKLEAMGGTWTDGKPNREIRRRIEREERLAAKQLKGEK